MFNLEKKIDHSWVELERVNCRPDVGYVRYSIVNPKTMIIKGIVYNVLGQDGEVALPVAILPPGIHALVESTISVHYGFIASTSVVTSDAYCYVMGDEVIVRHPDLRTTGNVVGWFMLEITVPLK